MFRKSCWTLRWRSSICSANQKPVITLSIFKSMVFGKDVKGISFKTDLRAYKLAKGKIFERNLNGWKHLASQNDSFTHGKVCTQMWSGQPIICPTFVLVRVWYLSISDAYTNNWGLFGTENYLTFDCCKQYLKIFRRSEVKINLTRPLEKMEASEFLPLYYIVFFRRT